MTYQLAFNHLFLVGDTLSLSINGGDRKLFTLTEYNLLRKIKQRNNLHINKQRSQSKINGKNSRWC